MLNMDLILRLRADIIANPNEINLREYFGKLSTTGYIQTLTLETYLATGPACGAVCCLAGRTLILGGVCTDKECTVSATDDYPYASAAWQLLVPHKRETHDDICKYFGGPTYHRGFAVRRIYPTDAEEALARLDELVLREGDANDKAQYAAAKAHPATPATTVVETTTIEELIPA